MFINAIEVADKFTRPIHSIQRFYNSKDVFTGAATLFFVNSDGWALTCKHVVNNVINAEELAKRKTAYEKELNALKGKQKVKQIIKGLEKKFHLKKQSLFEYKNMFMNCIEGNLRLKFIAHKSYDIALIQFQDYKKLLCNSFPVFPKDTSSLKQGKFLCRLGFPFPEFTNYKYEPNSESIVWTKTGRVSTPRFPIEGMLTRHLLDEKGIIYGFEMSTPGLRGQSGCPAFDTDGKVWGMQFATKHLDLNFDVNMEVIREGQNKSIKNYALLHVGGCIHVDILKDFMKQNNVSFTEQ